MFRQISLIALAVLAARTGRAAEPAALSDAADPARKTPPITYVSPFAGYRGFEVPAPQPWAESNERVRAVGGQMGVLRDDGADGAARPPEAEER